MVFVHLNNDSFWSHELVWKGILSCRFGKEWKHFAEIFRILWKSNLDTKKKKRKTCKKNVQFVARNEGKWCQLHKPRLWSIQNQEWIPILHISNHNTANRTKLKGLLGCFFFFFFNLSFFPPKVQKNANLLKKISINWKLNLHPCCECHQIHPKYLLLVQPVLSMYFYHTKHNVYQSATEIILCWHYPWLVFSSADRDI